MKIEYIIISYLITFVAGWFLSTYQFNKRFKKRFGTRNL